MFAEKRSGKEPPNPSGLCMCGCGNPAPIAKRADRKHGWITGEPIQFIPGHNFRLYKDDEPEYLEVDTGYNTPCWVWQRAIDPSGYGRVRPVNGGSPLAHRVVYERFRGAVADGLDLDHLCRNRACVNPDHLEPVTPKVNSRRGSRTILTEEQAEEIRTMRPHAKLREIAEKYGIAIPTVRSILTGRTWR